MRKDAIAGRSVSGDPVPFTLQIAEALTAEILPLETDLLEALPTPLLTREDQLQRLAQGERGRLREGRRW